MKRVLIGLAVVVLLGIGWAISPIVMRMVWRPKVTITCSRDDAGRLVVDLKPNWRVNSCYRITFWLEGDDECLWRLDDTLGTTHFIYGYIPRGARQMHPADGVPPRSLPSNCILYVKVDYSYDPAVGIAPTASNSSARVQITEDGGVKYLVPYR